MGGGSASFIPNVVINKNNTDKNMCVRTDRRNLVHEWIQDKQSKQLSYRYLTNKSELLNLLNTENTDYVLGEYFV